MQHVTSKRVTMEEIRALHESAGPPVAVSSMRFMPWCNRSSHNAMLPAAGLLESPGLGILGASAC